MEGGSSNVVEWTIQNFTSWNEKVHGNGIESPKFDPSYVEQFELYPKGFSGCEDHLVVLVHDCSSPPHATYSFDLSFFGPDGSVLCTNRVSADENYDGRLLIGPKYEDVVAKIRENEASHGDRLTLRCIRREDTLNALRRATTTIEVTDATAKIPSSAFWEILAGGKVRGSWISRVSYPAGAEMGRMNVWVFRDDESRLMGLEVHPGFCKKNTLVWTRVTVLKNGKVDRTEEVEHVVRHSKKWTISCSLSTDEVVKVGFSLLLRMKIVPDQKYRHVHAGAFEFITKVNDVVPTFASRYFSSVNGGGKKPENAGSVLSKDLKLLYQDRKFSDIRIKCGTVSFPVHRAILSARSPVFKTMLSTDMREATSNEVDIKDLDPYTLGLFLTYLYTGTVAQIQWESSLKLYYAADKYHVPSLKRECADFLSANVSFSNVCDLLSLADKHQDDALAAQVQKFISQNNYTVFKF